MKDKQFTIGQAVTPKYPDPTDRIQVGQTYHVEGHVLHEGDWYVTLKETPRSFCVDEKGLEVVVEWLPSLTMGKEILEEMVRFKEKVSEHSKEIIAGIQPFLIGRYGNEIKTVTLDVYLYHRLELNAYSKQKRKEYSYYRLQPMLNNGIFDGSAEEWVWEIFASKIDLKEFPNCKIPQFTQPS